MKLSEFDIKFTGLKQGIHFYEFHADNSFFEYFDCTDFISADFVIKLELTKQSTMILLNFVFQGQIVVPCDRCLEETTIEIKGDDGLILKFGNEVVEDQDEILFLSENEYKVNLAKHIYEFVSVNIPQRRIHSAEECDPEVIEKLNIIEIKNDTYVDPRWSGLQNLKQKN